MRCHALPPATLRKNSLNLPCLYFGAHENLPSSARWKLPIPRTGLREQASSSTPQACAVICWDASWLDIIRADRRVSLLEVWREELLGGGDALEFVAEVLKVFRADFQLQNFVDHRREVRQRTNDSERCCIGRPCLSASPPQESARFRLFRATRHAHTDGLQRGDPGGAPRPQCPESRNKRREPAAHTRGFHSRCASAQRLAQRRSVDSHRMA